MCQCACEHAVAALLKDLSLGVGSPAPTNIVVAMNTLAAACMITLQNRSHPRYDEEGTPMFHKSLSEVPPGLTPIRTRSDDFELDLANAHTAHVPPSPGLVMPSPVGRRP